MSTTIDFHASRTAWASVFFKHLFEHDTSIPEFINTYGLDKTHFLACFNRQDAFDVLEILALSRLTGLTFVQLAQEWEGFNDARPAQRGGINLELAELQSCGGRG